MPLNCSACMGCPTSCPALQMNCCIGYHNSRFFILFTFYACLGSVFAVSGLQAGTLHLGLWSCAPVWLGTCA